MLASGNARHSAPLSGSYWVSGKSKSDSTQSATMPHGRVSSMSFKSNTSQTFGAQVEN